MNTTISVQRTRSASFLQAMAVVLAGDLLSRDENVVVVENTDGLYLRRVLRTSDQHASFLLCFRPWLADFIWC